MKKRHPSPSLSESELNALTSDLDQIHHDVGQPALGAAVAEWTDEIRSAPDPRPSRRAFLLGTGGAVAGIGLLAALGTAPGRAAAQITRSAGSGSGSGSGSASPTAGLTGDLAVAATAASLENLAVSAYTAALQAAQAGKFGTVPPAIATFVTTAMQQHRDHAGAWNSLLVAAGKKKVTVTDPALTPTVNQKFAQVTTLTQLAQLALLLENTAAQTYQVEAAKLQHKKAITVAATIQPVEMQHAAILYYVLGEYPGVQDAGGNPVAFNPTDMAA